MFESIHGANLSIAVGKSNAKQFDLTRTPTVSRNLTSAKTVCYGHRDTRTGGFPSIIPNGDGPKNAMLELRLLIKVAIRMIVVYGMIGGAVACAKTIAVFVISVTIIHRDRITFNRDRVRTISEIRGSRARGATTSI